MILVKCIDNQWSADKLEKNKIYSTDSLKKKYCTICNVFPNVPHTWLSSRFIPINIEKINNIKLL
jgi:hypothetical protein